jgi:hypothetical protein
MMFLSGIHENDKIFRTKKSPLDEMDFNQYFSKIVR